MLASGLTGRMTVHLVSDDFDFHLAKGLTSEQMKKYGEMGTIQWFKAHDITFIREPHSTNN